MQRAAARARLDPDLLDQRARARRGMPRAPPPGARSDTAPSIRCTCRRSRSGLLGEQRVDLGDDLVVAAGGQVGVDRQLGGGQPQLFQPADLGDANGSSATSASGSPRNSASAWRAASPFGARAASATSRSSRQHIDQLAVDLQLVRAPAGDDLRAAVVGQHLAQPPDVVLDHLGRAGRRLLAPQTLDQPVRGDGPVGLQPEHRQDRALLGPAECDRAVVDGGLEVAEEPDLHARVAMLSSCRPPVYSRSNEPRGR